MTTLLAHCSPPLPPPATMLPPTAAACLPGGCTAPVTLIQAPAGAGKTVLMRAMADRLEGEGRPIAWVTLDPATGSAAEVGRSICRAFGFAGVDGPAEPSDRAVAISNAWAGQAPNGVLFLDAAEHLDAGGRGLLGALLAILPAHGRLVVASRVRLDLPVARMQLFGLAAEIGLDALRLEAAAIGTLSDGAADAAAAAAIRDVTDGWAAGAARGARLLRDGLPLAEILERISGRSADMVAFFREIVPHAPRPELSEFLTTTSFLDILDAELCDVATGRADGEAMLADAHSLALFIEPIDPQHRQFRLMRPFRDCLRRKLAQRDGTAEQRLCRTVAMHLVETGRLAEALPFAERAADPAYLSELLETHAEAMTYRGDILEVVRLAAGLSEDRLAGLPRLLLVLAWARARNLETETARGLIERARTAIAVREADGVDPEAIAWMRLLLLHRETMVAAASDEFAAVERNCALLIPRFQSEPYLLSSLHAQLIVARREQYRIADLPELEARSRALLSASACEFAAISLEIAVGPGLLASGKLDQGIEALERGYGQAVRIAGEGSALAAIPALPLAEALYERDDLDRASALIERHMEQARKLCFADQLISGYVTRARIQFVRGDIDGCLQTIDESIRTGLERNLPRLRLSMVAEKIDVLLRTGQASRALEIASGCGIRGDASLFVPGPAPSVCDEIRALVCCRLALAQDRVQDVLLVAKPWRRFLAARGAKRSLIRWNLALAICMTMEGEPNSAQRALRDAALLATEGNWIRSFVDGGKVIRTLVRDCVGQSNCAPGPVDRFQLAVLAAFGDTPQTTAAPGAPGGDLALYGRLLPRELEILGLVGSGMRNREIGMRLGLTEGTVKWYMTQIYDKVGVRRRPHAVDRARMFGLLA